MTRTASASQIHRRQGRDVELFVDANLCSFRVRQEKLYAVIYHPEATHALTSTSSTVLNLMLVLSHPVQYQAATIGYV
jgi:hypothetical protein